MLMGDTGVLGPTPMQSFKGSNFAGVPQPKLMNDSKSFDYSTEQSGTATEQKHILFLAAIFIIVAYAVWHFTFER